MLMASHRRIHNFGQQHRVPSIEVYSSSSPPKDADGEYIYYGPGRGAGTATVTATGGGHRTSRSPALRPISNTKSQQTGLISGDCSPSRDFRILSSSLNPLGQGRLQQPRHSHGRISNSRSTGNLSIPNEETDGDLASILQQKPVHHASSQGVLSSPRVNATKRQDSSVHSTPSPPRRRNFLATSPARNGMMSSTGQQQLRRERMRSPYASFDDYGSAREDDEDDQQQRDSPKSLMTFPAVEPLTVLGNIIRPTTHESTARKLEIRYSARNDKYKRPTNPVRMKANGWNMLVYAERNMEWLTEHCRHGEQDEVMTYLSRKPGTSSAYVEWRFDFTEAGLRVKKCSLKFPFETFEDGHVRVYLKAADSDDSIPVFSSLIAADIPKIRGWDKFSLVAELDCEREACAFQHAQLFRQQLKSGFFDKQEEKYQFLMSLELYSMY